MASIDEKSTVNTERLDMLYEMNNIATMHEGRLRRTYGVAGFTFGLLIGLPVGSLITIWSILHKG